VRKNLVLLGMMGVGKTTLGKIVAKNQGFRFIDTDAKIEEKCLMTVSEIFEKKGEKFFRSEEEKCVLESLKKNNCIIALGGGAFINKMVRNAILKNAVSIWLDVDLKVLSKRIRWNKKRPLLNGKNNSKRISKLYDERKKIYKLANYKISCEKLNKQQIVKKIISIYKND
jgi:shikimate kinase